MKKVDYTNIVGIYHHFIEVMRIGKRELRKFNEDMNELENYIGKVTKSKTHLSFALTNKEKLDIKT